MIQEGQHTREGEDLELLKYVIEQNRGRVGEFLQRYTTLAELPTDDPTGKITQAVYLGLGKESPQKKFFYTFPLKEGWPKLFASFLGDIRSQFPNKEELQVKIAALKENYPGKIYLGPHIELPPGGRNNQGKELLVEELGVPLDLIRLPKIPPLKDADIFQTHLFEALVPEEAISRIEPCPYYVAKQLDKARVQRWKEILPQDELSDYLEWREQEKKRIIADLRQGKVY